MPIRFRCPHCQQLLGIARRKAGTRVECPTCRASVLVPGTDQLGAEALPAPVPSGTAPRVPTAPQPPPAEEPLFERSDFEQLFAPASEEPGRRLPGPSEHPAVHFPVSNGPRPGEVVAPEPLAPQAPVPGADWNGSAGYLLTSRRASILTVVVILLMALSFLGGVLVGKALP